MNFYKQIKKAQSCELYAIAAMPSLGEDKSAERQYVSDYEILHQYTLSTTQQEGLQKVLSSQKNYAPEDEMRCPFIAAYAVKLPESAQVLIYSKQNCPKVRIPGKTEAEDIYVQCAKDFDMTKVLGDLGIAKKSGYKK